MNSLTLKTLAGNIQTPAYIFDLDELRAKADRIRKKLGMRAKICYAIKANPFLTSALVKQVDCFELCSPGEIRICERAGARRKDMVISGVYKDPDQMERLFEEDELPVFTAESESQLRLLNQLAGKYGKKVTLLLRLTSGNQFGMDEALISRLIEERSAYPDLHIAGLQYYGGTQKKNVARMKKGMEKLFKLLEKLRQQYGFTAECVEYGPGAPVNYFETDSFPMEEEILEDFGRFLDGLSFEGRIVLELGRFLAADCGTYLTRVADQKCNEGVQYYILDGGIHQMNYFGQALGMKCPPVTAPEKEKEPAETEAALCGALCTVNDVLVRQIKLPRLEEGDVLAFAMTGAYSITEGSALFLSRELPAVYFYTAAGGLLEVRKRTETDCLNSANI